MLPGNPRIGFIGFGEVAYYFAKGLKEDGVLRVSAFDRNASHGEHGDLVRKRAADAGVHLVSTLRELVDRSDLIISAVWGNVALDVAKETASFASAGKVYGDINNTAPSAKEQGATLLKERGVEFIDMALFTSPSETKHRSPILISGEGTESFGKAMSRFGMNLTVVPGPAGKATTIKTLVNIYYKGIQAVCMELALSAWKAGVDLEILSPLVVKPVENMPREKELPFWMVRGALHAARKTAELESIIKAVEEWGLKPIMLKATRKRLQTISRYDLQGYFKGELAIDNYKALMEAMDQVGKKKGIEME
jgi:3-hydroxyisobutyrate dehydrogenase-like beta-hydroxyacid dehydrogenase